MSMFFGVLADEQNVSSDRSLLDFAILKVFSLLTNDFQENKIWFFER